MLRRHIAEELRSLEVSFVEVSDYPFIYAEFLRERLGLSGGDNFKVGPHGSFQVDSDEPLRRAFAEMIECVRLQMASGKVLLVEFAHKDNLGTLRQLDQTLLGASRIVYVHSPIGMRIARLARRVSAPVVVPSLAGLAIQLSDDHHMPRVVSESLYAGDDLVLLREDPVISTMLIDIENTVDRSDPNFYGRCLRPLDEIVLWLLGRN